jgi:hypothetical protein
MRSKMPEGSRLLYISGEVGVLPDGTVPQGIEAEAEGLRGGAAAVAAPAAAPKPPPTAAPIAHHARRRRRADCSYLENIPPAGTFRK